MCVCLDNEALYNCSYQNLKLTTPNYGDLNQLTIAACMSGITCTFRFPTWDGLSNNLRKLATNLVPYKGLNFLIAASSIPDCPTSTPELHQTVFNARYMLCAVDPRYGRWLMCQTVDRGSVGRKEVDEQVFNVSNENSSYFVEWILNNINATICEVPQCRDLGPRRSATMIGIQRPSARCGCGSFSSSMCCIAENHSFTGTLVRAWTRWLSPRPSLT